MVDSYSGPVRRRPPARALLVAGALLLSGCLSFNAVSATGKLGTRVGEQSASFDRLYGACLDARAVGDLSSCAGLRRSRANVVAAMRAIGAYGAALRALAEAEDPDIEDNVTAALEALPLESSRADSVGGLISALTALLSQSYRQGQLREVINQAEPTIAALAHHIESAIAAWADMLDSLHDVALRELRPVAETPRVERLALASVASHAADARLRADAAARAVRAFAAAHHALHESGDLSAAETLVAVVRAAFEVGGAAADVVSGDADPEEVSGDEPPGRDDRGDSGPGEAEPTEDPPP